MIKAMVLLKVEIAKVRAIAERLRICGETKRMISRMNQAMHLQEILDLMEAEWHQRDQNEQRDPVHE